MGNIEEWARKWLENQRHEGKKCLEIKMQGSNCYVYHSTNRYDKAIKKGRKVSKYLGKLDKEKGFIPKGQNKRAVAGPRTITEYGNSMLLHEMMKDIKPLLKEGFSDHWATPFACVIFFDADREIPVWDGMNYTRFRDYLEGSIQEKNIFHAIKMEGTFSYVKTRSVPGQEKPYPPLIEVTANQPTFEFHDIEGTIVGFYCPDYVEGLNVPGYHLHFITADRKAGGHVLEFIIKDAKLSIDYTSELHMILPDTEEFNSLDLTKSRKEELEEAEK